MKRLSKCVLILALLEKLKENGSWCGETHIQKASYFLKEFAGIPIDYDFILYKHGPFSFDLRDELTAMRADGFMDLRPRNPYGATLEITEEGNDLMKRFPLTISRFRQKIDFVAEELGGKGVSDLEKLATALFVIKNEPDRCAGDRADRIHELKPHVTVFEAQLAIKAVEKMMSEFDVLLQPTT
jgi:uncharacterized protein YwgA